MSKPWLARYLTDHRDTWIDRVYSLNLCSVATNAFAILAIKDGGVQHWPCGHDDEHTRKGERLLAPFLNYATVPQYRCSLRSLAQWCEYVTLGKCPACEEIDEQPCPLCDGKGFLIGDGDRAGILGGVLLNRNKLAWMLAPELFETNDEVLIAHGDPGKDETQPRTLFVEGDTFLLVMMGCKEATPEQRLPFYPDPLFAELYAGREDQATRCALIDWLTERDDLYADILRDAL